MVRISGSLHAAGGEGGRAEADAAGLERRIDVEGNGVFVDRDAGQSERLFGFAAEHALAEDIDQHEVGVGAAGDDAVACVGQGLGQHLGVGDDLRGVVLEARAGAPP